MYLLIRASDKRTRCAFMLSRTTRDLRLVKDRRVGSTMSLVGFIGIVVPLIAGCPCSPTSLDIVDVGAPDINCKFDTDCAIEVSDFSDHFELPFHAGDAFLLSRGLPPGEPGTAAQGLYGYEYRLDLRDLAGLTALGCINSFTIDFGPVVSIDYDDDGSLDDVYVVTAGGLGSVAPTSATQTCRTITFTFSPGVCAGSSPGNGESTFFFGLTSTKPSRAVVTSVRDTLGSVVEPEARAPEL